MLGIRRIGARRRYESTTIDFVPFFGFSTVTFAEGDMEAPDSGEVSDVAQKPPESKNRLCPKAQHAKNMKAKKATGKAKQRLLK